MEESVVKMQIEQARTGDEQAMASLIAWQMPAIRGMASRAVCPGLDFDDAVQEGLIGLFHAMETYESSRGASFGTYAGVCMQNAIVSAARAAGRQKHSPLNTSVPLSEQESTPGPEEIAIAHEGYANALRNIETRLSTMEKRVLGMYIAGESYSSIARYLSITEKAVDNALQRARAKLK